MTNKDKAEVLQITQEVLRGLMISLAGASKADMNVLSELLIEAAKASNLAPHSRIMLEDLAQGPALIAKANAKSRNN